MEPPYDNFRTGRKAHPTLEQASSGSTSVPQAGTPLSLTIRYADKPLCGRLLERILIPLAHRFHHVDLTWEGGVDLMPFFVLCPEKLNSAAFRFPGSPDITSITHVDVISLSKVSLSSVTSSSLNPQLCDKLLVWNRLTHLIITEVTDAHILVQLLSRCRNLLKIACVIAGVENRTLFQMLPTLTQQITSPCLNDFEMILHRPTGHSFLPLHRLKFPVLRRFRLCEGSPTPGEMFGGGTHFISQLSSINDLGLSGYTLTPSQLLDTLRLTPNLITLNLDIRVNYEELFHVLTRTTNAIDLVPLLETIILHLQSSDIPTFSSAAFVNMVRSRQEPDNPSTESTSYIRDIFLLVPPEAQLVSDDLAKLVREGSSIGMPTDRIFRRNLGSFPFSISNIDLASW